jgi:hypothetical protein
MVLEKEEKFNFKIAKGNETERDKSLRLDGFEPSTLSLKVRCSTTELKSRNDPDGIRTRVIGMKIRCPRPG